MSPQDLAAAIIAGLNAGGEQFLEGTLAAALPIIWIVILGLHLGRPYILDMIDRFTLRLGADLLWLVYVGLRDLLIVSGVVMSFMFFFPDVVVTDALPLTGGLAAACLFGVLLIKLMGDPDHNLRDFRLVSACWAWARSSTSSLSWASSSGVATSPFLDHHPFPGDKHQSHLGRWPGLRLDRPARRPRCDYGRLHLTHWWAARSSGTGGRHIRKRSGPMTPEHVTTAITQALVQGGAQWMVATIVAFLPALWTMTLILQLGRPYVLRTLRRMRPASGSGHLVDVLPADPRRSA